MKTTPPLQDRNAILDRAHELAREFESGAAERDRERRFPTEQMQQLRTSGLQALFVPPRARGFGGAVQRCRSVSFGSSPPVIRTLRRWPSSISMGSSCTTSPMPPALQAEHNKRVVSGELWWTNAYSELGGKSIFDYRVKIEPDGSDWVGQRDQILFHRESRR